MSNNLSKLIKFLLLFILLLSISMPSFAARNTAEDEFALGDLLKYVLPSASAVVVQSKTDTGVSLSANLHITLLLNLSVSSTQLGNETLNNTYLGIMLPIWFDSHSPSTFISLNGGTGNKGKVEKFGISHVIESITVRGRVMSMLTLNREIYPAFSQFDNTQLGVRFYFLIIPNRLSR